MSIILLLVWIMFAHWVADFVCQTDKMALNKSKSNKWLSIHIGVYTLALTGLLLPAIAAEPRVILYPVANGLSHWLVDYVTSRLTTWAWTVKEDRHLFFVIIGFDQFLHVAILLLTLPLLFSNV